MTSIRSGSLAVLFALAASSSGLAAQQLPLNDRPAIAQGLALVHTPTPLFPQATANQKDPTLAGVLSFLIPGVGSFYAGNTGHGIRHLGIHVGAYAVMLAGVGSCGAYDYDCSNNGAMIGLGALAIIANDVWSIFTAVDDAKAHNGAAPAGRVIGNLSVSPAVDGIRNIQTPAGSRTNTAIRLLELRF